jgi:hypothetical protein
MLLTLLIDPADWDAAGTPVQEFLAPIAALWSQSCSP